MKKITAAAASRLKRSPILKMTSVASVALLHDLKVPVPPAATAAPSDNREPSAEESAAIKIQAIFRGHLARRAFRALKSLVKLQAVARGVCVRRQARMALNCMHALVRLQVRVRARHLLSTRSDD
ncbi:hypothetical protein Nepgr_016766 [Nepenthes gracilis]|uniref:Uncharacterized protein n=1 Tax=Nepenthes gracilis TaxID=150966 RepID=A0AAD3XSS7_NEPGR|nr:hypothetical protein Nepgr_016766 [Nepenthes gracilis]